MKKMKMFFAVAALLLVTAGVFAGKAKFNVTSLYYLNGASYIPFTGTPLVQFTTTGATQATITNSAGTVLELYYEHSSGSYLPVFF